MNKEFEYDFGGIRSFVSAIRLMDWYIYFVKKGIIKPNISEISKQLQRNEEIRSKILSKMGQQPNINEKGIL